MDYCSTCRRHLNGALVCPGCGAYAPDIAPLPGGAPAPIATAAAAPVHRDEPVPYRYAEDTPATPNTPAESFDAATASGRAGRRRQRERWKKTQRRALVATAVALVGGGLTVASMNRQSTDRTQAASAPDREPMGVAEEEVDQPTAPGSTPSGAQRGTDSTHTPSRSSAARPDPAPLSGGFASRPNTPNTPITANAPHEQSAPHAPAGPVQQRPAHQDAPTPAPTPSTGSSQNHPAPPADSGSASKPTPAPTPPSPSPSGPSGGSSSGSGSSSDATDPAGLCLLGLICVK